MLWPTLKYSRNHVNRAGDILAHWGDGTDRLEDLIEAFDVLTNWRSCHTYPINTFQATLRQKLKNIDRNAIVAQRIKRVPSIVSKLRRFSKMRLSRMQDIGGLRAIVDTLNNVTQLKHNYNGSRFHHELITEKDYIAKPKPSGYRGVHLVYRYNNIKNDKYNGLLIELQIRDKLQHAWATAVETMGTFLNQALKSSEGPDAWLNFFALAGSAFAHLEKCPPVVGFEGLSQTETFARTIETAKELSVKNKLAVYSHAVNVTSMVNTSGSYHLVVLDPDKKSVDIKTYSRARLDEANEAYTQTERRITEGENLQAVLVSAGSIEALRRAYPNYFLDTKQFIMYLDRIERKVTRTST